MIQDLINQGKDIKEGLQRVPPPQGVIRLDVAYCPKDVDEYYRWKEISLRYLQLYYSVETERFVGYSEAFEKHSYTPRYLSNMIGVLEACHALPSTQIKHLNYMQERTDELLKVLKLEDMYSKISSEKDVIQSIKAFHEWHAAASVLFDKWIYATDTDWMKFQDIQSDGNAYVLSREFSRIYTSYKKLIARLQEGRGLKNSVPINAPEYPVKHATNGTKINIFISYAHADETWLEKLKLNLKVISRYYDHIQYWDDTKVNGGDKWREEISDAISRANVAILLVSTAFLASDFISNNELPAILKKAQEEEGVRILPIIVSPCAFEDSVISDFQAINSPDKTLAELGENSPEVDRVFLGLNECIKRLL